MADEHEVRNIIDDKVVAVRRHLFTVRLARYALNDVGDRATLWIQVIGYTHPTHPGRIIKLTVADDALADEGRLMGLVQLGVAQLAAGTLPPDSIEDQ